MFGGQIPTETGSVNKNKRRISVNLHRGNIEMNLKQYYIYQNEGYILIFLVKANNTVQKIKEVIEYP